MSLDFRATQIQTTKVIASGTSTGANAKLLVYGGSAASDQQGTINSSVFNTSSIGSDVFMFVSGGSGKNTSGSYSVSVFGGDTAVSGVVYALDIIVVSGTQTITSNAFVPPHVSRFIGDTYMSGTTWYSLENNLSSDIRFVFESSSSVDDRLLGIRNNATASTIDVLRYTHPYTVLGNEGLEWHSGTKVRGSTVSLEGMEFGGVTRSLLTLRSDRFNQNHNYVFVSLYDSVAGTVAPAHTFTHESDGMTYYTIGHSGSFGAPSNATIQGRSAVPGFANTAGGTLTVRPGASLGTGYSKLLFQASAPTGSGTGTQVYSDIVTLDYLGTVVSGTVKASAGFSGSLTKLYDGTNYLVAGNSGITITTQSNGAIAISGSGGGSGADLSASFVVAGSTASLPNAKVLTAGPGIIVSSSLTIIGVSVSLSSGPGTTINTQSNGSVGITSSNTPSGTIAWSATGPGLPLTGSSLFTFNNNTNTVVLSGTSIATLGFSGSLTKLTDGTSFIIAGANITVTSVSNGAVTIAGTTFAPINSAYVTVGSDATLTGERSITGGDGIGFSDGGANSTITISASIVAGPGASVNTQSNRVIGITASNTPSGAIAFSAAGTGSPLTGTTQFTFNNNTNTVVLSGTVTALTGFSGSLTKLANGTNYLFGNAGIFINTQSNGAIGISASIVAGPGTSVNTQSNFSIGISTSIAAGPGASVNTQSNNTIGITASNAPSGTIAWSATGVGSPLTGSANFTFNNNINAVILSGTITALTGFSGSLTKLANGTNYLFGNAGIFINTQSNGAIGISASIVAGPGTSVNTQSNFSIGISTSLVAGPGASVNTQSNNTIGITASNAPSSSIAWSATGVGSPLTGSANFTFNNNTNTVVLSGTVTALTGFSGSHTKLSDGTSFIIAGTNITVTSVSNGAITIAGTTFAPINSAYVTIGSDATLTGERALTGGDGIGFSDAGANSTVTISASIVAGPGASVNTQSNRTIGITASNTPSGAIAFSAAGTGSPLTGTTSFTFNNNTNTVVLSGTVTALTGFSGSHTKLADGTSFIIAGANVTVTSVSNGAITIAGTTFAPINSAYVTIGNDATLTGERALVGGNGIGFLDGGANGSVTISASITAGPGTSVNTQSNGVIGISASIAAGPGTSVNTQSNGTIGITASNTPSGTIAYSPLGTGSPLSGSGKFTFNDNGAAIGVILSGTLTTINITASSTASAVVGTQSINSPTFTLRGAVYNNNTVSYLDMIQQTRNNSGDVTQGRLYKTMLSGATPIDFAWFGVSQSGAVAAFRLGSTGSLGVSLGVSTAGSALEFDSSGSFTILQATTANIGSGSGARVLGVFSGGNVRVGASTLNPGEVFQVDGNARITGSTITPIISASVGVTFVLNNNNGDGIQFSGSGIVPVSTTAPATAFSYSGISITGTDKAGGDVLVSVGRATGLGTPSAIRMRATITGSGTGATQQDLRDHLVITNNYVDVTASMRLGRTLVNSNMIANSASIIYGVNTTVTSRSITLPAAVDQPRQWLVIKDEGGSCATNAITLVRSGTDTIDGGTTDSITTAYGSKQYYSDGVKGWWSFGGGGSSGVTGSFVTTDGLTQMTAFWGFGPYGIDFISTSGTPATPAANHLRIYSKLSGSKMQLVVMGPDGIEGALWTQA